MSSLPLRSVPLVFSCYRAQNRGSINRNNNITIVITEDKNYEVYTPKVGGLISLRTLNITNKLTSDTFRGKLATYINKIVKHMKDPKINFDNKNKPEELTEEEVKSFMNKIIQYREVKQYV